MNEEVIKLKYKFLNPYLYLYTGCGGHFTEPNGILTSPNWPNEYNNRDACAYYINVPDATQIVYYFTEFSTEFDKDLLYWGQGYSTGGSTDLQAYQGDPTDLGPFTLDLTRNSDPLWFLWETDRNVGQRGWRMVYAAGQWVFVVALIEVVSLTSRQSSSRP